MEAKALLNILDADLQGYRLLQELVPHQTFLCCDASDNLVVLKRLEDDCLHRRQLHPSIRDRLARVRELAHPRIATLRTVEQWEGSACLVWTYLDGQTWEEAIAAPGQDLLQLCSDLAATVEALHETGIVHGSLHGRNIIVRPDRQVWLTHVSPYLYADPRVDVAAVINLLRHTGERFSSDVSARLTRLLDELEAGRHGLREFSHLMLGVEKDPQAQVIPCIEKEAKYRLSSVMTAAGVVVVGAILWVEIHGELSKSASPMPTTFPSLRRNSGP